MSEDSALNVAGHTRPAQLNLTSLAMFGRRTLRAIPIGLPAGMILLLASSLIPFDLPNNFDRLDESSEPLKTLKFVHTRGHSLAKWPPMPQFLYAPVYAVPLASWYFTGALAHPSTEYPYGFSRPFEQQGLLILLARTVGVAIGTGCVLLYGRSLLGLSGSAAAVFLALLLCVATSEGVVYSFVATKPDGLMLAFLAASMAIYADILGRGFTGTRGILLSLFAVGSISCKELTAPVYLLPYAGIAVVGWLESKHNPLARRRFLADLAVSVATGIAAYLVINVVYAPATWLERMHHWVGGAGKDPNVWAPSSYSTWYYARDVGASLVSNLGPGGLAIIAAAGLISFFAGFPHRILAWLPSVGFFVYVVGTAGYMPNYFLLPLNITLALPVALALADAERSWIRNRNVTGAALAVALPIAALCLLNVWQLNLVWTRAYAAPYRLEEEYCKGHVGRTELIHLANLWVRQSGADRLSYLGYNVDDRPLGEIMGRPERMPDVILVSDELQGWLEDFKNRPARDESFRATGYSYSRFEGFAPLGYRLVDTLRGASVWGRRPPWIPIQRGFTPRVFVYRRDSRLAS